MKLKFKYQRFQTEAAKCVTDVFIGQQYSDSTEYMLDIGKQKDGTLMGLKELSGFGNTPLMIERADIVENIRTIQIEQGLQPIDFLQVPAHDNGLYLTIEMETGTGKTYTYIKTMYELNKLYGWSKFIVVVPSVAIREGVYKSFQIMQDHFAQEYDGKRMQFFIYNSSQLSKIDSFASDNGLHVMIINTQAFNSSMNEDKNQEGRSGDAAARIIFSKRDEFGSRRPIDILAKTNPIMIIDEPQSVLGANANNQTRKGIAKFNPLFSLLYSATHREKLNMVYRLDAMDAYNKKLVKKIEVKGISQKGSTATNGFIYLEEIIIGKGNPRARISFDKMRSGGTPTQVSKIVDPGFDLYEQSGELAEYNNRYIVEYIDGKQGIVRFANGTVLHEGEATGQVSEDILRRMQIRETIRTHFERERDLFYKGIKVLSLFFIDHVENYRTYDGGVGKGKYAEMFEEEYVNVLQELTPTFSEEKYTRYLSKWRAEQVHNGYFSRDKKSGNFIDSRISRGESGSADESAYDLIMKDKERLLSFDEPTRFIFSHSALKEGWDNPNVFQICTLKDSDNETNKRQEVGRGMRLCVNKDGERQDVDVLGEAVFETNILTVIASESYDDFANKLQKEIADAVGDRPVIVTPNLFDGATYINENGVNAKIPVEKARKIYNQLIRRDYVDDDGKLTDKYYTDVRNEQFDLGEELKEMVDAAKRQLDNIFNPNIGKPQNARDKKEATFKEEMFKKKEFQNLWKRINVKTYYRVDFETEELVKKAIKALDAHLTVTEIKIVIENGSMENIRDRESLLAGSAMKAGKTRTIHLKEAVGSNVKYDLIGKLVEETGLTRKTIVSILKGIEPTTFAQFKQNPEEFIVKTANIINDEKAMAVVQQITYNRTDNTYDKEIFTQSTLRGKLGFNAIESTKSLYDLVVVDSEGVERSFAETLEKQEEVEIYTKLPNGFYINTPMGKYNPDWAIAFREGAVKHIYFVAETKGNEWQRSQLRGAEDAKLECAARHFAAISNSDVIYGVAKDYKTLYDKVMK